MWRSHDIIIAPVRGKRVEVMLGYDRITFAPNVMGGRACIRGLRVPVSLVVNLVANGMTLDCWADQFYRKMHGCTASVHLI